MRLSPALSAEMRRILSLAWPVALTSLNWTILHVTDVIVVGFTGTEEVAALGASRALTFPGIVMGLGALSGVLVHVSRADGAKDLPGTGRAFHQGLLLAIALGMISALTLFALAEPMLRGIGVAGEIAPLAADVVRVMALAYPFQLLIVTASFFLEGVSRPQRVTVVNLAILPVNALLAWALSGGHLGLPALGAVGAALATTIASALGAAGMIGAAWTLPRARQRGVHDLAGIFSRASLKGALGLALFGLVPAIASGLELIGFSILIALSTELGEVTTHAFQIVFSIHNVTFSVALGLGSAAGVRAGNAVGEGVPQAAARRAAIAAALAALATGVLAALLILIPHPFVALFPAVPEVQRLALAMLPIWAPFILFDGMQVVFVYALRSLGDQVVAGVNSVIAFFLVTGGAGLAFVHLAGWGATGLVLASGFGMVVAAALHGTRLWWINRRFR
ncbi:MAG: MATE family efflux transporter [Sphingomonas sp.]|uniref:MATE family efflux transporter n=1 Tax=unclassified Sphingomonas TaxID=196159 RepID=UPI0024585C16|nr:MULTISPECIES: MATE family efflux transporter [unclassified Sphingomonas]MBQ1497784.1 MATE family efflux transporter [Sphingomonas sp.]MDH4746342.1 MATE family efflux transporter [Sphingomonas sp. CBMAI 2297]